ncbi:MAG TPA: PTS sugar transporter subunit IIB [Nitrospirota bacterium]|nr:PTS sugar transporter subunit IIB [Nitrospirota bacterium]
MIVFIRIDDRLIHGQVVEGWVNYLKASCLLVADDAVASNSLQRSIMELAVPQGLKVMIGSVEEICGRLRTPALDTERVILLFSNPVDVLRAIKAGMDCPSLNVGGMHFTPGKRKLMEVLAVNEGDLEALREISGKGVKIDIQTVPTQRPIPLGKILDACAIKK